MEENVRANVPEGYLNPVFPRSFPDPFVLKFCGDYFAYCTDFWHDGNVFGILRSRDLVNWSEAGGAMKPLDNGPPFYWAPEVTYSNGKFYLYYSAGNETLMEIRVAVSDRPDGGFVDSGNRLTKEEFAIDAHVFTDDDGKRYLFYATDFLQHTHIGTGTVVDEMIAWQTLAGNPRTVTRAKYDWQVYDPHRIEKGGVRWHTVEGPFILKRKGIYYEMFSGGNWQNVSYGVSFAVTDDINLDKEWQQFSDGEKVLPILRTIPDTVVGPGHNSAVRGPDNRELYCVYHRWTENGRVLAIDRMDFAGGMRIFVEGPSVSPQRKPQKPSVKGFSDKKYWHSIGDWELSEHSAITRSNDESELICKPVIGSFLCEVSLKALSLYAGEGSFGVRFTSYGQTAFEFLIFPGQSQAVIYWQENKRLNEEKLTLPEDFAADAFHLLRIDINGLCVSISLDEAIVRFAKLFDQSSNQLSLIAKGVKAEFAGFALTDGFKDLFERPEPEIEAHGWKQLSGGGLCIVENGELLINAKSAEPLILTKGSIRKNYEFSANLRFVEARSGKSGFGFVLIQNDGQTAAEFDIGYDSRSLTATLCQNTSEIQLPKTFELENYHQFRFLVTETRLRMQIEENILGEFSIPDEETKIGIFCRNGVAAVEMVRYTAF